MRKFLFLVIFHFSFLIGKSQHTILYGSTSHGGNYNAGVLFKFDPFTLRDSVLFNFSGSNGSWPEGNIYLSQNDIYGCTQFGGSKNEGVLFKYSLISHKQDTLIDCTGSNDSIPGLGLLNLNGVLYGVFAYGGNYGKGGIFSYDTILKQHSLVFSFNDTDGLYPEGGFFLLNDSTFIGITTLGGLYINGGVIYSFNPKTNKEKVLYNLNSNTDGAQSGCTFTKAPNGFLYGLTYYSGISNGGTLISFDPSTNHEATLVSFNGVNGLIPFGNLFLASNGLLYGMTAAGGNKNAGVFFSYNYVSNQYNIVFDFDSSNGAIPQLGNVIEDTVKKILYGLAQFGGTYDDGVLFSYNLNTGKDSVLLNFNGANGANPLGTLLLVYDSTTGTEVNEVKGGGEGVKVYPNPTSGIVQLIINNEQLINSKVDISASLNIEVYNVFGQCVYSSYKLSAMSYELDLSGQPNGVYFYRVIKMDEVASPSLAMTVGTGKIVIQK